MWPSLGMIEVDPRRQSLLCAAADRRDFYHQIAASFQGPYQRFGPRLVCVCPPRTRALKEYLSASKSKALSRELRGDCFAESFVRTIGAPFCFLRTTFWSASMLSLKGTSWGVETATCAHGNFLEKYGLLSEDCRLC